MALVKRLNRCAKGAFAPNAPILATGTAAGLIDSDFSTSASLEVFHLDYAAPGYDLQAIGRPIPAPSRFQAMAWGALGIYSNEYKNGVLASAHAEGQICLWDLGKLAHKPASVTQVSDVLLSSWQPNDQAVTSVDWNPHKAQLLASSCADGSISIWDLTDITQPMRGLIGPWPSNSAQGTEASCVQWNAMNEAILASCYKSGATGIWDMRKQKMIISLRDPNSQRRCSSVAWSPRVNTHIVAASELDSSPTLQLWDLRNSSAPLLEFVGHTKGVLAVAWCPQDDTFMISGGKDNCTIVWDTTTGDKLCELPRSNYWTFDVQWSRHTPGIFSTATLAQAGSVDVCNLTALSISGADAAGAAHEGRTGARAPVWMQRPVSASFGFGGRLVTVRNMLQPSQPGAAVSYSTPVTVSQVVTESDLLSKSTDFENAIKANSVEQLRDFCAHRAAQFDGEESETWAFLQVLFEGDTRQQLLSKLGLQPRAATVKSLEPSMSDQLAAASDNLAAAMGTKLGLDGNNGDTDFFEQVQPTQTDFFDNLETTAAGMQGHAAMEHHISSPTAGSMGEFVDQDVEADEYEDEIQKALFIGHYETAVDCCLKANRMADALVIAHAGGPELYKKTSREFMRRMPRPYMHIILALEDNDWSKIIKARPIASWKETLAIIATYSNNDTWCRLCEQLGNRLAAAGMVHPATLCYIIANNVDAAVKHWCSSLHGVQTPLPILQNVLEKSVLMSFAAQQQQTSSTVASIISSFAERLAVQGQMAAAMDLLQLVPDGDAQGTDAAVLKDRIYRSGVDGLPEGIRPPSFPFSVQDVRVSQELQQRLQQAAAQQHSTQQHTAHASAHGYPYQPVHQQQQGYGSSYGSGYAQYGQQPSMQMASAPYAQPSATYSQPPPAGAYSQPPAASAYSQPPPAAAYAQSARASPYSQPPAASAFAGAQPSQQYGTSQQHYGAPPQQSTAPQYGFSPRSASYGAPAPTQPPPAQPQYSTSQPSGGFAPTTTATPAVQKPATFVPQRETVATQPPTSSAAAMPSFTPAPPVAAAVNAAPMFVPSATPGVMQVPPPAAPVAAPAAAPPPSPAPPTGPPADVNIGNVNTSRVKPEQRGIIISLTNAYQGCSAMMPAKRREMDDVSKRVGQLFWRLNEGEVSPSVVEQLIKLCQALDQSNFALASQLQVQLTTSDWDECHTWLTALKRLIKARQQLSGA